METSRDDGRDAEFGRGTSQVHSRTDYLLLDRDERFQDLNFQRFDLRAPEPVAFAFDGIFLDPPFANVTPDELAGAVLTLCGERRPPLFVGARSRGSSGGAAVAAAASRRRRSFGGARALRRATPPRLLPDDPRGHRGVAATSVSGPRLQRRADGGARGRVC